jgi:hypothetical protein
MIYFESWWARRDSNLGSRDYESRKLTVIVRERTRNAIAYVTHHNPNNRNRTYRTELRNDFLADDCYCLKADRAIVKVYFLPESAGRGGPPGSTACPSLERPRGGCSGAEKSFLEGPIKYSGPGPAGQILRRRVGAEFSPGRFTGRRLQMLCLDLGRAQF